MKPSDGEKSAKSSRRVAAVRESVPVISRPQNLGAQEDDDELDNSSEPPPLDNVKIHHYSSSAKAPITSYIDEDYLRAQ